MALLFHLYIELQRIHTQIEMNKYNCLTPYNRDKALCELDYEAYKTIIGVFAQGQILCIFPNCLQVGDCDAPPHFGWPKMNFDRISRHFRSIRNFLFLFHKMAAGGHFGWPKITYDRIYRHFRSILNFVLDFVHKMAAGGHFGWPKFTFDRISRHFRSIRNFYFVWFFFTKCLSVAILEVRFGPFRMAENHFQSHFSPFKINTQLLFVLIFFHKMAAGGHFGWPKITFDRISRHFRWIRNFIFFEFCFQKVRFGLFLMTENHFRSHLSPFQINTQLFFKCVFKMAA